jgi:hypothetical protein
MRPMSFRLTSINQERIVLTKEDLSIASLVFMSLFGVVFTWVALWIFFGSPSGSKDSTLGGSLFLFCGIVPFVMVFWLIHDHRKHIQSIIFHAHKGYIEVLSSAQNPQKSFIPFSNIATLSVTKGYEKGGKKNYPHFYLEMYRKDGEKWLLMDSSSFDAMQDTLDKFNSILNLDMTAQGMPMPMLPPQLTMAKTAETDTVEWRLFDWTSIVSSGIVSAVLGLFLGILAQLGALYSVFGAFFGFMLLIFFSSFCYSIRLLITKMETVFGISVSSTHLHFYEKSSTGRLIKSKSVEMVNIKNVTNSLEKNMTAQNISVYIHEKDKELDPSMGTFKKIKEKIKGLHQLYFSDLTFVESLELERWIQDRIQERANIEIH